MVIGAASRRSFLPITLVFMMLVFSQCMDEDSTVPAGQGWTSADPTSIPLRHRELQAERGNLVKNPSFELGRLINLDSNTVSYNITGWKTLGENVSWIRHSPDSNIMDRGVHSGYYAIKIERNRVDEAINQGDGIVSDFIRVIPGNYEFSFWIRLRDIHPIRERLGKRMDDAVDIRLLFYDKNRLLISGNAFDPVRQVIIDRSFKALSFADFWKIDSLEWSSVTGRTTNDLLTEGDIPDEAKYVKLYLGLKGTGTMLIDDVDFRYTRRNFTSLERTEKLFDTTCTKLDLVVPEPKRARALEPFTYHIPGTDSPPMPVIVLPGNAEKQTMAAADLLKTQLEKVFIRRYGRDNMPAVRIVYGQPAGEAREGGLVFNLGERPGLTEDRLPGWQAYIIRPDSTYPNLVHLSGASPEGDYYAAATAVQLLDDSLFVYHQASIVDYPDIPSRAFLISPVAAASNPIDYSPYLSDMSALKLNWGYLDFYRSRTLWQQESQAYLEGLRAIGRENHATGMLQLAQMVNPYAYFPGNAVLDSLGRDLTERWTHSGTSSRLKLMEYFNEGIQAGVSTLVLCCNDYLPRTAGGYYSLYAESDRDAYISLQAAHLDLIRSIESWIRENGRKMQLEFIPPWYSNEEIDLSWGQAEQYFLDLGPRLPADLKILWSGPASQSTNMNILDFNRFHDLAGRDLVLIDNSMNAIPEILADTSLLKQQSMKLRTLNLFDPFSVSFSAPLSMNKGMDKMLINASLSSGIMKIRIATAADYMWNTGDYDPDLSLWKVLVSRYGMEAAHELYRFNDAYFTTLASMVALKQGWDQQRHIRIIHDQMLLLEGSLGKLEGLLAGDPELINELKSLRQHLERIYEKEIKTVASQIIAATESL
jgi:hypothetical protein